MSQLRNARCVATSVTIVSGLRSIGVKPGDIILVHSRMSALGFVPGAARTIVESLINSVGPDGTVMMPAYSGSLSDPATWRYPPVPDEWIEPIRRSTPPYDPARTPTEGLGAVAEYFRTYPGALRSGHPHSSFTALGARARELVEEHSLQYRFGPGSPLGRLKALNGRVLMLGAPLNTISFLYLVMYALPGRRETEKSSPIVGPDGPQWQKYRDIEISDHWFEPFIEHLLAERHAVRAKVGDAVCHLFDAAPAYYLALEWCRKHNV